MLPFQDLQRRLLGGQEMSDENDGNAGIQGFNPSSLLAESTPGKMLPKQLMDLGIPVLQQRIKQMGSNLNVPPPPPPRTPQDSDGSERSPTEETTSPPSPQAVGGKMLPGGVPASRIGDYINAQDKGLQDQMALISKFANQPNQVNYAPLLSLVDSWNGTKMSGNYQQPLSPQEKQEKLAKMLDAVQGQRQKQTSDILGLTKTGTQAETSALNSLMRATAQTTAAQGKTEANEKKYIDQMTQKMSDAYNLTKTRGNSFGQLPNRLQNVRQAEAALYNYPKGDLDRSRIQGLVTQLAKVEANSNVIREGQMNSMLPHTGRGIVADIEQFFTNKPQSQQVQAFVKAAYNDLMAEKESIKDQIRASHDQVAPAYSHLQILAPLNHQQIEENFEKALGKDPKNPKGSIYKYEPGAGLDINNPNRNTTPAFSDTEKEKRYQEWKAKQK